MRRGILGSIAALAAGAGAAWGQEPMPLAPAGGPIPSVPVEGVIPANGQNPVIMPPVTVGPPGDPNGFGPTATLGPPPGPMYPPPGPYAAPLFQPPPPSPTDNGYGAAPHVWFHGDYLLLFTKGQPVNFPLLTTSAPTQAGQLGDPSTTILVPSQNISYGVQSGFRLDAGFFGDADRRFGGELNGWYSGTGHWTREYSGNKPGSVGTPVLARPYIDPNMGPAVVDISGPNIGPGTIRFSTGSSTYSAGADAVWNFFRSGPGHKCVQSLDVLAGYKYLELDENFYIKSYTTVQNGLVVTPILGTGRFGVPVQLGVTIAQLPVPVGQINVVAPATVAVSDQFRTKNQFNGGDVALRYDLRYGMFTLSAFGRLGIGDMHETVDVSGYTAFANPNIIQATVPAPAFTGGLPTNIIQNGSSFGGLLANNQNIGHFHQDRFVLIPEVNMSLGINLTSWLNMHIGYNFIYITRVVRPGNMLTPIVDSATVPFRPEFGALGRAPSAQNIFPQSSFLLQGVNFGFTFRY